MINNFNFYAEDMRTNTVVLKQRGVFRTNCLDCLDRTNIIQTKIAVVQVDMVLSKLGVNLQDVFSEPVV